MQCCMAGLCVLACHDLVLPCTGLIYISVNSQKNPQSLNGKLTGSLEGLSKRQKKRLNRRLSKSKENTPEKYIIPSIPENVLMDR